VASWAGGTDGREVTDKLIPLLGDLLSPGGCFYLHAIQENNIPQLKKFASQWGLSFQGVRSMDYRLTNFADNFEAQGI